MLQNQPFPVWNPHSQKSEKFTSVFNQFYKPLCFFCLKMIKSSSAANDIASDIFVKLWERLDDFSDSLSIKAFIYIAASNSCKNFYRHGLVEQKYEGHYKYMVHEIQTVHTELDFMIQSEFMHKLYDRIEQMPRERKKIFKLAYVDGLTNPQIVEVLGIAMCTVKDQKRLGLKFLRLEVKKIREDED